MDRILGAVRRAGLGGHIAWGIVGLCLLAFAPPAQAQNPFSPAIEVNDSIITHYEINQRARLLEVLNAQGDLRQQARDALVNETLQVQAGRAVGAEASPDQIEEGIANFAARADSTTPQLLSQMSQAGVSPETLRDFIGNGITWNNVIRARFSPQVRLDEADIERALELGTVLGGGREILLAELIIPVTPDNEENLEVELARLGQELNGDVEQFSEAARRFSAAPTREEGGLTGWRPVDELPPALRDIFLNMRFSQVTEPLPLGGGQAFALFQFRGEREVTSPRLPIIAIDYVTFALPGGRSPETLAQATAIGNDVDVCNDFNGVIPGGFERHSVPPSQVPDDIALALRTLDNHELSTAVTRNNGATLLAVMLCDRVTADAEIGFDGVRNQLFTQQVERLAESFLSQLRAEARINFVN